jgi:hypothetical protein
MVHVNNVSSILIPQVAKADIEKEIIKLQFERPSRAKLRRHL